MHPIRARTPPTNSCAPSQHLDAPSVEVLLTPTRLMEREHVHPAANPLHDIIGSHGPILVMGIANASRVIVFGATIRLHLCGELVKEGQRQEPFRVLEERCCLIAS